MIALFPNTDPEFRCIDVDIVESAPQNKKCLNNKLNKNRLYKGVGKALIAFACGYSFICGLDGFVALTSKTSKYSFYNSMGAKRTFGQSVYFPTNSAKQLTERYLPGSVQWW